MAKRSTGSTASSCSSLCISETETSSESDISRNIKRFSFVNKEFGDVIQDLVIQKFTDTLTYYKLRRLRRKQKQRGSDSETSSISTSTASSMENIAEKLQCIQYDKLDDDLAKKSVILYHVMVQTSKALRFCQNRREFFNSVEHVEAERLLLFSSVRREAILEELRKENCSENFDTHRGTIKISNLTFTLKQNTHNNINSTEWFVCLLKNGPKIFCTEAIPIIRQINNGTIRPLEFYGDFVFDNLPTYFDVEVCFYGFVAEKKQSKFFLSDAQHYVAEPSFKTLTKTTIRIADLKKTTIKLPLGTINVKIEANVNISECFKGFLTVGLENRGTMTWNRRFCFLDGRLLKYWNYPQEQEADIAPLEILNLECCATRLVDVADRSLCSRPRTLLLETNKKSGIYETICKHFLSADTVEEMKIWREKINAVVLSLRSWGENKTTCCFNKCSEI